MIGKPEWFQRRKYGGWGIHPKTWQGGVYLALILIPFIVFQILPNWSMKTRLYVTGFWLAFVLLDTVHIMIALKKDERESKIEAMSERNAAWVMMLVLVFGIFYELIRGALQEKLSVNLFLVAALFGGLLAKTISNVVLERRGL